MADHCCSTTSKLDAFTGRDGNQEQAEGRYEDASTTMTNTTNSTADLLPPNLANVLALNKAQQASNAIRMMTNNDDKQAKEEATKPKEPFKFAGYLAVMAASLFASLLVLCVKLLPVENTIQEKAKACLVRGVFMTLFCAGSVWQQRQSFAIPKGENLVIIVRAILGALNTFLVFVAIQFITMGEVSALKYSSPVWTCMLAFLVLRERIPISLVLGLPLSFLGIIMLGHPELIIGYSSPEESVQALTAALSLQSNFSHSNNVVEVNITELSPGDDGLAELWPIDEDPFTNANNDGSSNNPRWPGILAGLGSSLCISSSIIILKFRKKTPIATCSFYMGVATVIVALVIQLGIGFGAWPTTFLEWFLHMSVGFFAYACQCTLQYGLQFVPAGSYSVVRSLDIVICFVLGAAFLDDIILWTSIVGSIVIMLVVTLLMFNEYFESALARCRRYLKSSDS